MKEKVMYGPCVLILMFLQIPLLGQNLSGIYTIGTTTGGEDYNTLTAAIADLKTGTITGDVEYHLGIGTYNETIDLSDLNNGEFTVTFSGASKELTIVHPLDWIAADQSGISINNANHVILENFTLVMDDISSMQVDFEYDETRGISISGGSDITLEHLILDNSKYVHSESYFVDIASAVSLRNVEDVTIASSDMSGAGVLIYLNDYKNISIADCDFSEAQSHINEYKEANVLSDGLTISRNTFAGPFPTGRYGGPVYLFSYWSGYVGGVFTESRGANLTIEDNTMDMMVAGTDDLIGGINVNNWDGIVIRGNSIEDGSYGIRISGGTSCELTSNQIYRTTNHGIYFNIGSTVDITNNVVTSSHHSVVMRTLNDVKFRHNTISAYGTLSTITTANITNLDLRNNIFHVENTVDYEVYIGEIDNLTMDHNLFSGNANTYTMVVWRLDGGYETFFGGASLGDWQANQELYDQNSRSFNPVFAGTDDFHITDETSYRFGTFLADVAEDIDGDLRNEAIGVDVGADQNCIDGCQLSEPTLPPVISNFSPDSGSVGTRIIIFGDNFDETPDNNIVYFGATKATVVSAGTYELLVDVPAGASNKPITVLTNGLIAESNRPFQVTFESDGMIADTSFDDIVSFGINSNPLDMEVGDLDGDGLSDLVSSAYYGLKIAVQRNNSSGPGDISFEDKLDFDIAGASGDVALADFDGDGKLDIAVGYYDYAGVSIFRNVSDGNISLDSRQDFTLPGNPGFIVTGDLDADGRIDLIATDYDNNVAHILKNTSTGAGSIDFSVTNTLNTGSAPGPVAVADIDGDYVPDLVVSIENSISVLLNTGALTFAAKEEFAVGAAANNLLIGDLDRDGAQDIVVSLLGKYTVFKNSSSPGILSLASSDVSGSIANWAVLEDINGDSQQDILGMHTYGTFELFKNTSTAGAISFNTDEDTSADMFALGINSGDLDNDGEPEMLILGIHESEGDVVVFRNLGSGNSFKSFILAEQSGSATIDAINHTIEIDVEDCTDPTALIASFELSPGASVVISSGVGAVEQISGVTANDFTMPVAYTVTSEDGVSQTWIITVNADLIADNVIENVESCENYEFDGQMLTVTGQYFATYINAHGCDSLVTLNLTILEGTSEECTMVANLPSELSASRDQGDVTISWVDNSSLESRYRLQRSDDGIDWVTLSNLPADSEEYLDEGLMVGEYLYRVRAIVPQGSGYTPSAYTESVWVRIVPEESTMVNMPTDLQAEVFSDDVTLYWEDNSDIETIYRLQRSGNGADWTTVVNLPGNTTEYEDIDLEAGTYYYRIRAIAPRTGASPSAYTPELEVSVYGEEDNSVNEPTEVSLIVNGDAITVSWRDNSNLESLYRIQRSDNGGGWFTVGNLPSNTEMYEDTGLLEGEYQYRIRALTSEPGVSPSAYTVSVRDRVVPDETTIANAPMDLTAEVSDSQVTLSWIDNSHEERLYRVQRRLLGEGWSTVANLPEDSETYVDMGVVAGIYDYRVRAVSNAIQSSPYTSVLGVAVGDESARVIKTNELYAEQELSVRIYPNPVTDELRIEGLEFGESYRIVNLMGTTIQEGNATRVDVSDLSSGVYLITTSRNQTQRFIKR